MEGQLIEVDPLGGRGYTPIILFKSSQAPMFMRVPSGVTH